MNFIYIHHFIAARALKIGLEQIAYTVSEVDGFRIVCLTVFAGNIDGREITLDYSTSSGTAGIITIFVLENVSYMLCMLCSLQAPMTTHIRGVMSLSVIMIIISVFQYQYRMTLGWKAQSIFTFE